MPHVYIMSKFRKYQPSHMQLFYNLLNYNESFFVVRNLSSPSYILITSNFLICQPTHKNKVCDYSINLFTLIWLLNNAFVYCQFN